MKQEITRLINAFDGKSIAPFRQASKQLRGAHDRYRLLVEFCEKEKTEVGGTWILKDLVENGDSYPPRLTATVVRLLSRAKTDDGTLHLLQTLPHLPWQASQAERLFTTLRTHLESSHKFVRAWTYNALGWIAKHDSSRLEFVKKLFEQASKTESASVRARIRQARKSFDI